MKELKVGTGLSVTCESPHASRRTQLIAFASFVVCVFGLAPTVLGAGQYQFDGKLSREVLENYLSRSITMEGLLNGRGDLDDNLRMLKSTGAKFIGRSLCLWGGEANLLQNLERAKQQIPKVRDADPEMILQACVFEIVSTQVEQVPVPDWAFVALCQRSRKGVSVTPTSSIRKGSGGIGDRMPRCRT